MMNTSFDPDLSTIMPNTTLPTTIEDSSYNATLLAFTDADLSNVTLPPQTSLRLNSKSLVDTHLSIYYTIIGVFGILGNSFVIILITTKHRLRKSRTNIYIVNQSVLDFLVALVLILQTHTRYDARLVVTSLDFILCKLWDTSFFFWAFLVSSTFNLVAISVERYIAIVYPIKHRTTMSRKHLVLSLVIVWCIGPLLNCFAVIRTETRHGQCYRWVYAMSNYSKQVTGICSGLVQFFIPIAVHSYCYGRMWMSMMRKVEPAAQLEVQPAQPEQPAQQPAQPEQPAQQPAPGQLSSTHKQTKERVRRNIFKTLFAITVCFVLCWVSNQCIWMAFNFGLLPYTTFQTNIYHISIIALYANCFINPIVYFIKYELLRTAVIGHINKLKTRTSAPNS